MEKLGSRPPDSVRHVIFLGTVMSAFQAVVQVNWIFHLNIMHDLILFSQIINRAAEFGNASFVETTRVVVPNEIVSRLIGKGGSEIRKLQETSGVQKIDVSLTENFLCFDI